MNFKKRLTTGIVTAAMFGFLVAIVAPAAADASHRIVIRDNGFNSTNTVDVEIRKAKKLRQRNRTTVWNWISILQNTGGNTANKNTGGDVDVNSGNADVEVLNSTETSGNSANVDLCGCEEDENTIVISDNGAQSDNTVLLKKGSSLRVSQSNRTFVKNDISVEQNTGDNTASQNTGGDVDVDSGDAEATVNNTTTTGGNELNPSP